MSPIDLGLILVYIVGVTLFGGYVGSRSKGLDGYFLGGKAVPAWAVTISIVATETSTLSFLSVPGISYRDGGDFTYLQLALGYIAARILVAVVLLPGYFKGKIETAYQVLSERFGGATKTLASLLFLVSRTLGDGLRLFLTALVLKQLLILTGVVGEGQGALIPIGLAMPAAIALMGVSTIIYTFLGGMTAVVWTDVSQFLIYILGALAAFYFLVRGLDGGWADLVRSGAEAGKFRLFDFRLDPSLPYTFWSGMIGGLVLSMATHGADQMMVQRYLSARSQRQAAGALIASGFIVLGQFALFLLIGVGLAAHYVQHPPSAPLPNDEAFSAFIVNDLPNGLVGLVVAAIFSAAMSTLSSSLNASASSTVNDLIRPSFPKIGEERLLTISRFATVAWGIAQIGVATVATTRFQGGTAVEDALAIASFFTGIILGVFLLGILVARAGQAAAFVGMVAGLAAVSYMKFGPSRPWMHYPFDWTLAWPYFALVGSGTTLLVGWLMALILPINRPLNTDGP